MNKFLTIFKGWYGVLVLILLAGGVLWFVNGGMPKIYSYINNLRENWEVRQLQAQWEKPYRDDTYGGKTPEETYDMFLDALRKGDTELASKYFVVDDQEKWAKTLSKFKEGKSLEAFTKERENIKNQWEKIETGDSDTVGFRYSFIIQKNTLSEFNGQKITIPAGNYTNETTLELNKYTKIWKISSL